MKIGLALAVVAWKSDGRSFVSDARQRLATRRRMRDEEGYVIPPLPVFWVEASSRKEAAEKVLASSSAFGEMSYGGLFEFMNEFEFDVPLIESEFIFPEIDLDRFSKTYFPETKEVAFKVKAKPPSDDQETSKVDGECPKCGYMIP